MAGANIPATIKTIHDEAASLIEAFCRERLNEEYREMCLRLLGVLARKRPSPLINGKVAAWASGIVRAVGYINFLDDRSQPMHMKSSEIDAYFGVSAATGMGRSKKIRDMVKVRPMDPEWTLPSRMERNPMAWMIKVNGLLVDARWMPREVQEMAFQQGLIPYLPQEKAKSGKK